MDDAIIEVKFQDLCRLCATPGDNHVMISIDDVLDMVHEHLSEEISSSDGLPSFVCLSCNSLLIQFKKFFDNYIEANEKLIAWKNQLKIETSKAKVNSEILNEQNASYIVDISKSGLEDIGVVNTNNTSIKPDISDLSLIFVNVPKTYDPLNSFYDPDDDYKVEEIPTKVQVEKISTVITEDITKLKRKNKRKYESDDDEEEEERSKYDIACFCSICKLSFPNVRGLRKHKRSEIHMQQLNDGYCNTCNKNFNQEIKYHTCTSSSKNKKRQEISLHCQICDKDFETNYELEQHEIIHYNGPFICFICNQNYENLNLLQNHIKLHTNDDSKKYQCKLCGKFYKSLLGLKSHIRKHIKENKFVCYICNEAFKTKEILTKHRHKHSKEEFLANKKPIIKKALFGCEYCGKSLSSKASLIMHIKMHKDLKEYECDICYKKFRQSIKLKYHKRLHTGNLPYSCDFCDKRYNTQRQLDTHVRTHTNERPYICEKCGMRFRSGGVMARHKNTHSETPLFSCKLCNKPFRSQYACAVHEKSHTGENKKFMCDICGRSFITNNALDRHKLRHNKQRVVCLNCNATFASKRSLRQHFERKHTEQSIVIPSPPPPSQQQPLQGQRIIIPIIQTNSRFITLPGDENQQELIVEVVV